MRTKPLHLTAAVDKSLVLASRNIPKAKITTADNFHVYEVLNANTLIINESAIEALVNTFN